MKHLLRRTLIAATLISSGSLVTQSNAAEKWTDSTGAKTIEADFVSLDGIQLKLRKSDGTEIVLPLFKLDDASRLKARRLASPNASAGAGDIAGASSLPLELSDTPVQISEGATIEQTIELLNGETAKGNYLVAWDALTAKDQQAVQGFVVAAADFVDPAVLKDLGKLKTSLISSLRSKKSYILNSKELGLDPNMSQMVSNAYDPIVELIEAIVPDEQLSLEALKKEPIRDSLKKFFETIIPKVNAVVAQLPMAQPFLENVRAALKDEIKVTKKSETSAEVTSQIQGFPPTTAPWVRVDGRWMPKDQVEGLAKIDDLKKGLASFDKRGFNQSARQAISGASLAIGVLENAEGQSDVDEIIRGIKGQAAMLAPVIGGAMMPKQR